MPKIDPVILFFLLGALAGLVKSDLRIPQAFYNTLSIYLLLSIGMRGGIELSKTSLFTVALPALGTVLLGALITLLAFLILQKVLRFDLDNAAALATHYGSVSAVTFAVVTTYLETQNIPYEEYMTVLLVMLEIPAIVVGIGLHKLLQSKGEQLQLKKLTHDILTGKSLLLLVGGLFIGLLSGKLQNTQLNFFFLDLFKGFLAIFMLEMGVVASERFGDLKKIGLPLLCFGIAMPLLAASIGAVGAHLMGLSVGGSVVLATMAASASYIAAPTAVKMAIPQAHATYYLTAALGVTFPFNIILGIPLYTAVVSYFFA